VSTRGALAAVATFVVAVVVALAVPVSQLRTVSTVVSCCCPDPTHCHCPDHKADHSKDPSMRACHKTQHVTVAPLAPEFVAVATAMKTVERPAMRTVFPEAPLPQPDVRAADTYGPS
jgi:hypothetical protein